MQKKQDKIQTQWNLKLFYSSINDPQIETDIKLIEKRYQEFADKYQNEETYLVDPEKLLEVLRDFEQLSEVAESDKPLAYLYYCKYVAIKDIAPSELDAKINKTTERLTKASNLVEFFRLKLGKIKKEKQKLFLSDENLKKYQYFLSRIWLNSKYYLSEEEEKVLSLKSLPSKIMWRSMSKKLMNKLEVKMGGQNIPLAEAGNRIPELSTKARRALHKEMMKELSSIGDVAEAEINALYTDKKINDELRGLANPYTSTVLRNENDEKTIELLVKTVTDSFELSKRFYRIKAKLLGLKKMEYPDRAAALGEIKKKYDFAGSVSILQKAFGELDDEYVKILDSFLKNGQIDVYPQKGKESGAFCSGSVNNPTMVLLNHIDSLKSVMTFGHEMGHAIHSELSKSQGVLYQGYSTSVAETASTFFEDVVYSEIKNQLTDDERVILLHERINDDINTIFRQVAVFNFELELHHLVRAKGYVSKEEIGLLMNKHMSSYLGETFKMHPEDGNFFIFWSHIRNYFYVYTYAFGRLVSRALSRKLHEDKHFALQIKQFLSMGSTNSPGEIFAQIGIDINDPKFFEDGLLSLEAEIDELEKIAVPLSGTVLVTSFSEPGR